MTQHAQFEIASMTETVVTLRDLGPHTSHLTVTNDAEWVVEQVAGCLRGRRLEYYDSEGELTGLKVKDGKFDRFGPPQ